jgi:hypothetical protein
MTAGRRGAVKIGFGQRPQSAPVCDLVSRNVAVDNIDACGSKVVGVSELNYDAYVVYEADVILVNWSNATDRAPSPGGTARSCASRRRAPVGSP